MFMQLPADPDGPQEEEERGTDDEKFQICHIMVSWRSMEHSQNLNTETRDRDLAEGGAQAAQAWG